MDIVAIGLAAEDLTYLQQLCHRHGAGFFCEDAKKWKAWLTAASALPAGLFCEDAKTFQAGSRDDALVLFQFGCLPLAVGETTCMIPVAKTEQLAQVPFSCRQVLLSGDLPGYEELYRLYCRQKGQPVIIAKTRRLLIRETIAEDLPKLRLLYGENRDNPGIRPFLDEALSEEALLQYRQYMYELQELGMWTVLLDGQEADDFQLEAPGERRKPVIGQVGICPGESGDMLGYLFFRQYQGAGYASEAVDAVLAWWQQRGGKQLQLETYEELVRSVRLAEQKGFRQTGREGNKLWYQRNL